MTTENALRFDALVKASVTYLEVLQSDEVATLARDEPGPTAEALGMVLRVLLAMAPPAEAPVPTVPEDVAPMEPIPPAGPTIPLPKTGPVTLTEGLPRARRRKGESAS
jgi:hypothetical protein